MWAKIGLHKKRPNCNAYHMGCHNTKCTAHSSHKGQLFCLQGMESEKHYAKPQQHKPMNEQNNGSHQATLDKEWETKYRANIETLDCTKRDSFQHAIMWQ